MADRSVDANETFADFRDTYIATCTDIGDMSTLGNTFQVLLLTWWRPVMQLRLPD